MTILNDSEPTMSYGFEVFIEEDVLAELNEYATAALPTEIGGLACLSWVNENDVLVDGIHMLPQRATGGTFEIDSDEVNKLMARMVQDGKQDDIQRMCSIVHTHPVGMGPSMSGTDIENIKALAGDDFFFSLILGASTDSSSERIAMHYAQAMPHGGHMMLKDLPVTVLPSDRRVEFEQQEDDRRKELRGKVKAHASELVTNVSPVYTPRKGRGYSFDPAAHLRMEQLRKEEADKVWGRWDDDEDYVIPGASSKGTHGMTDDEWSQHVLGIDPNQDGWY